jgi:HEAT repeat protein
MLPLQPAAAVAEYEEAPTGIAAVHFLDADPETGMVEFTFQAVRPVRVRGSIRDEEIRRILARALLEEENPGVRIRTVSAIAAAVESSLDPKVKAALIKALREDPNPGVRKEALKALRQGPMDNDVQDALIDVLESDKNEGMRVDAINSLTALGAKHPAVGEKLISVLQRRTEIDDNRYIRLRAEAMLKEVQQR